MDGSSNTLMLCNTLHITICNYLLSPLSSVMGGVSLPAGLVPRSKPLGRGPAQTTEFKVFLGQVKADKLPAFQHVYPAGILSPCTVVTCKNPYKLAAKLLYGGMPPEGLSTKLWHYIKINLESNFYTSSFTFTQQSPINSS
ncbi:hypothetical protein UA08_09337 [Talaromyces atroroseus]|uniref:Uncharacterized protein n=1 Tax=Talaromyces atroroseus TaxID=1441469 RepID=A0A1Q5Q6A3_TALAT|nr:hypothetical protein UA08_09337 [Talaromyces atroroseus]OKL55398.1 hypothetical protein UA08_09337 [Talaromyces atroroseus]